MEKIEERTADIIINKTKQTFNSNEEYEMDGGSEFENTMPGEIPCHPQ